MPLPHPLGEVALRSKDGESVVQTEPAAVIVAVGVAVSVAAAAHPGEDGRSMYGSLS